MATAAVFGAASGGAALAAAAALMARNHTPAVVADRASVADPAEPPGDDEAARTDGVAGAAGPRRSASEFRPSLHGFSFVNRFEGSSLPRALRPAARALDLEGPPTFGLCGGMCFVAADCFLASAPIPGGGAPPSPGEPLFEHILRRQTESLGPGLLLVPRFAEWMNLADDAADGTFRRSLDELTLIRRRLERGHLAAVGLVLAGPRGVLWQNHQVLAYAANERAPGEVDLSIYDPNFPGRDDAVIRARLVEVKPRRVALLSGLTLDRPTLGVACRRIVPGQPPTPVRGIFLMPYTPAAPPAHAG